MFTYPSEETVKQLNDEYQPGMRVVLVKMGDIAAPPIGTEGTVVGVDDIGTIMVHWNNGSSLGVVYGEDEVKKLWD